MEQKPALVKLTQRCVIENTIAKPTNFKERFSVSESDTISKKNRELARQNQKLIEQNERLKTTIGILKDEFKRSAGHKIADQSINRLVSRLKGQNKSTIESLSSRRAWIEMIPAYTRRTPSCVALLTESVDRKMYLNENKNKTRI